MRKFFIKFTWAAVVAITITAAASTLTYGQALLYEKKSEKLISRGLSYEYSQRITINGPLDVHVLTIDLTQEHLELKPVVSQIEHGLKEPTSELLEAVGAIAGVNGDFFGVNGDHSAAMGVEIIDGHITSASEGSNSESFKNATLFIDKNNSPFMEYVKTELSFYNNGVQSFDLYAYNRVTDAILPFYIDKSAYKTTEELDARFPNLYKIIVQNNYITYISKAGEVVNVPETEFGYVIVMNEDMAKLNLQKFAVGQHAYVLVKASVDYNNIEAAISGGGKILSGGMLISDGYFATGRHPRTALGISSDGSKLIMMVVDGRNGSIGATHEEMAALLLEYGAYNAMHLDGGGSSTVVIMESDGLSVQNEPSDGKERKVVNAFGVFNNSTPAEILEIAIETPTDNVFNGAAVKLEVFGIDEYRNKIKLNENLFKLEYNPELGFYNQGYFYPRQTGEILFTAAFNGMTAEKKLNSMELAQITVDYESIKIAEDGEIDFIFYGRSTDGYSGVLAGAAIEVVPRNIAYYWDGKIIGLASGVGYVKINVGSVVKYIKIVVGAKEVLVNPFEPVGPPVSFLAFPEKNPGHIVYTQDVVESGTTSLELAYTMQVSKETQAAYVVFDKPIQLPDKPVGLKISVYGDNSGNWLRAKILDADGKSYALDLARNVDWTGFETVEVQIPESIKYPISIERIYIASLENTFAGLRKLYFNNLIAVYPIETGFEEIPASTLFMDGKMSALNTDPQEGEFDVVITSTDFIWYQGFTVYEYSGATVINLTAAKGSMYLTSPSQWQMIETTLKNTSNNIIVAIDKNPLYYIPKKEYELLHSLLAEYALSKNIVVVSPDGVDTVLNTRDAVRYVTIGEPSHKLRLRFGGENGLRFGFQY